MINLELTPDQTSEAKKLFKGLVALYTEKADLEVIKKGREETLKYEVASACDIVDKKGEVKPNKVKMNLVNALLDEQYRDKENKKVQEYETMKSYEIGLKSVSKDIITSLVSVDNEINETQSQIKDLFKEDNFAILDSSVITAIDKLAKEEYKNIKSDKLEQNGYTIKSKDSSDDSLMELIEALKEILK